MSDLPLDRPLPVGAIDTRSNGWWATLWLIATEAALFAYLLFSYFYIAVQPHQAGTFPTGGIPSLSLSAPSTVILILSSVAVGIGQHGIMHGRPQRLVIGSGIGLVLAILFAAIQIYEWHDKHFVLATGTYSSLYFTTTGFHLAHVGVGIVALAALFVWSLLGYFSATRYAHVHIIAAYWHFVDVVWLFIFFTFYLSPRLGAP